MPCIISPLAYVFLRIILFLYKKVIRVNKAYFLIVFLGQDQTKGCEGGAWLAMTKFGKLGCLTNIRSDDLHADLHSQKRSRGTLVSNYVKSSIDATSYLKLLKEEKDLYRPFNILAGDVLGDLLYLNNVDDQLAVPLKKGICLFLE